MRIVTKTALSKKLRYRNELIRCGKDQMISLTDMHRAVGCPANKDPSQWLRLSSTRELIDHVSNMGFSHIWRTTRGNQGGTWAVPALAITYASYLSIEFYAWAHHKIAGLLQNESKSGADRRSQQISAYVRQGKSVAWATRRVDGVPIRHKFTDALKDHGITESWQYGACTNAIYKAILGQDKNGALFARNLPPKANLRDHLSTIENAAVSMGEALAESAIAGCGLTGHAECRGACEASGDAVKLSLAKNAEFMADHRRRRGKAALPPPKNGM